MCFPLVQWQIFHHQAQYEDVYMCVCWVCSVLMCLYCGWEKKMLEHIVLFLVFVMHFHYYSSRNGNLGFCSMHLSASSLLSRAHPIAIQGSHHVNQVLNTQKYTLILTRHIYTNKHIHHRNELTSLQKHWQNESSCHRNNCFEQKNFRTTPKLSRWNRSQQQQRHHKQKNIQTIHICKSK